MKLVDILARELKEWPEGWPAVGQACDGSLHGEPYSGGHTSYRLTVAKDYITAEVTKAQWQEAQRNLKKPGVSEWNGEGLPPVGTVCEYRHPDEAFDKCKIEHYVKDKVVFTCPDYDFDPQAVFIASTSVVEFRPIRTPEQIAAEEREAAIKDMAFLMTGHDDRSKDCFATLCGILHDHGYRKQEPKPE